MSSFDRRRAASSHGCACVPCVCVLCVPVDRCVFLFIRCCDSLRQYSNSLPERPNVVRVCCMLSSCCFLLFVHTNIIHAPWNVWYMQMNGSSLFSIHSPMMKITNFANYFVFWWSKCNHNWHLLRLYFTAWTGENRSRSAGRFFYDLINCQRSTLTNR